MDAKQRVKFIMTTGVMSFLAMQAAVATPLVSVYTPMSYLTTSGSDSGQPVSVLQTMDEVGMVNNPTLNLQLRAKSSGTNYAGYRSYIIPTTINPAAITSLQVRANFQGPDLNTQTWTWKIYDWIYQGWVPLGTNAKAFSHGPWTVLIFNIGRPFSNYINATTGEVRIQTVANNITDDANLDYEAVVIATDTALAKPNTAYFVSTTGSDKNPGTQTQPWATISHAARHVAANSTVYVRGGVYPEKIFFPRSGSATDGYITFMSYPGEQAIIDGKNIAFNNNEGTPGLLKIKNKSHLIIQNFEIKNIINSSVFVAGIAISDFTDHIELRNNHIDTISSDTNSANAIGVYGTSAPDGVTNIIIDGNEINNLQTGQGASIALSGNVQYFTVSNNVIHDADNTGIDILGSEGLAPQPVYDQARNGKIIDNIIYNISDNSNPLYPAHDNGASGIAVDGGAHVIIHRNILHHNDIGLKVTSSLINQTASDVKIANNIFYFNSGAGLVIGGDNNHAGSADNCNIVNNTFFKNDTNNAGNGQIAFHYFPAGALTNNVVANNIFYAAKNGWLISNSFATTPVNLHHNLYFAPVGSVAIWQWQKQNYSNFNNYLAQSGELNSVYADPLFVDLMVPILFASAGSPAINMGDNLGMALIGSMDVSLHPRTNGATVDVGAYEISVKYNKRPHG